MEAVAHALGCIASKTDSKTTHAIVVTDSTNLLQTTKQNKKQKKSEKGMAKVQNGKWQCWAFSLKDFFGLAAMNMVESKEMTEKTDWQGKKVALSVTRGW